MENNVSKMGMPKAKTGKAKPTIVSVFVLDNTLAEAMVKPKNKHPQDMVWSVNKLKQDLHNKFLLARFSSTI